MTCIVGCVDRGNVYMGADSAGVSGWDLTIRADPKVFRNGEFLIGFTSSFRLGQLLRYAFAPPVIDGDLFAYMATSFVDGVRECLKSGGYARKENEEESAGVFLVGLRGRLFRISSDYHVGEALVEYLAAGAGEQVALGAMFANESNAPEFRIQRALEAAEYFNIAVRGPFTISMIGPGA